MALHTLKQQAARLTSPPSRMQSDWLQPSTMPFTTCRKHQASAQPGKQGLTARDMEHDSAADFAAPQRQAWTTGC